MTRQDNHAVFTIENQGEGLSDEVKHHLFDKFNQADSSHKEERYGLGLALVKKILDFSGDEISAENTDNGCKFTVRLKLQ